MSRVLVICSSFLALFFVVEAQTDNCNSDLSMLVALPFNASGFTCRPVWNTFILRYSQTQEGVLSIVLSAEYTMGWVGMGFSKDGLMIGSSAMVGWIGREGRTRIKQYFLRGRSKSEVIVNEGQLQSIGITPAVFLKGATIYLAFQLKFAAPLTKQALLFAFGSATPVHNVLTIHDDKTTVMFDFSQGSSSASSSSSALSYPSQLKKNHGLLAIFGWGVLLPIGAIIARYFRNWDPLWFYLHSVIQFVGFIVGLAGVVAGITLYNKLNANVTAHRALGIFILVLGILQVSAFFFRPDKDSKIRKYWNRYHHWAGRLLLFLAAVNIVIGIHVGGAGNGWKVGYGINLAVILVTVTVLEALLRIRWSKMPSDVPSFQMHPTDTSPNLQGKI